MSGLVSEERILRELRNDIVSLLDRTGLLTRVFGRFKTSASIEDKILRKKYNTRDRLMQDLIGLRVASYFWDDLAIVRDLLGTHFREPVEEVRDAPDETTFQPTRWNLVFRLPDNMTSEVKRIIGNRPIDTTFEIQLRTVLAEGWHEVEHDLRYKRPDDWDTEPDMSRVFNGLLASLENADWAMLQLFDRLAYQKYRTKKWESMLRMKYRLRLSGDLSAGVSSVLDSTPSIAKQFFRARRNNVVRQLTRVGEELPFTVTNFAFLVNRLTANDDAIIELEPGPITRALQVIRNGPTDLDSSTTIDLVPVDRNRTREA